MTEDDPPEGEPSYEVGYCKPPKHTQFKKGNRHGKGRPRGSRSLASYVKDAFEAKVPVKIKGKVQSVSKIELSLHQLANRASTGDLKAIEKATALYERHCPSEDREPIAEEETAYDLETLRHHLRMQGDIDSD